MQYDTAHSLAAEIRQSSEWQEYHRLKEEVMGDETTAALIREYKKLQLSLQVAAMSGRQGEAEDMQTVLRQRPCSLGASEETAGGLWAALSSTQELPPPGRKHRVS